MIKRMMLVALVSAAVLVPSGGAKAAQLLNYRAISGTYTNGPDAVSVFGFVQEDHLGNNDYAFAQVSIQTTSGSDSGVGVLDVVLDPTGTVGRLSGTIQGNSGPITVDAAYLSLFIDSNQPPGAFLFKTPGQPELIAGLYWNRLAGEFVTAMVSSGVGTVDASGANASSYSQLGVVVP